ncbi:MAG: BlaI/MecI/CopY family transcriptional regulator [Clostridia bacterium]|nr:BlaI/MecI/CopY family transcriptional regulator [Clostridia bacterium]
MDKLHLAEGDYRFMTIIWDNEPLSSRCLVELCLDKLGWKKSTTYTTLKKMCDKGFAENNGSTVTSLVEREKVQSYASEHFVDHTFGGSLPRFLAAFLGGRTISQEEAAELKRLIDQHKEV